METDQAQRFIKRALPAMLMVAAYVLALAAVAGLVAVAVDVLS